MIQLEHPNLCNIEETIHDKTNNLLYLVLELLGGGSMQEVLERQPAGVLL